MGRTVTDEEKMKKKDNVSERTAILKKHFPSFKGPYRSGGKSSLADLAVLLGLANEKEASDLLDHMSRYPFAPGSGYTRPFENMKHAKRKEAFDNYIQDEKYPFEISAHDPSDGEASKKKVTMKDIFSKGLFAKENWPLAAGEPDETVWNIVTSQVMYHFHKDLAASSDEAKAKRKAADQRRRDKERAEKSEEHEDEAPEHGITPKRRRQVAQTSKKRAKVENNDEKEEAPKPTSTPQQQPAPASYIPPYSQGLKLVSVPYPFPDRAMVFTRERARNTLYLTPQKVAKAGVSKPEHAGDLDAARILVKVRQRFGIEGPLTVNGVKEEEVLGAIAKAAFMEEGNMHFLVAKATAPQQN